MIQYYRNQFLRRLEGRELTMELVEEVAAERNGWLRNVFRHHAQYLYRRRLISPELFGWIMEAVPARSYHMDMRPYRVDEEEARRTLEFLRENSPKYYLLYRLMLEGDKAPGEGGKSQDREARQGEAVRLTRWPFDSFNPRALDARGAGSGPPPGLDRCCERRCDQNAVETATKGVNETYIRATSLLHL